jgi:periplasmic divalent cation tolerance protein
MVFIYTTCASLEEARRLGSLMIERKIAACVDYWPVESCYMWEGSMQCASQAMLMITTLEAKTQHVDDLLSENHSYSIPLIAGVDIRRLNRRYKEWMAEVLE